MDAAVYAERKREKLAPLLQAAEQLEAMRGWIQLDNAQRSILSNAAVQLRTAANQITKLGDGLNPYTDPDFYRDLPPSLASEDQGKHAASAFEYVFSE